MSSSYSWREPVESLNLRIDASQILAIAERELHASRPIDLLVVHRKDRPGDRLAGACIRRSRAEPRPGSRLYAETLWTQITVQLLWNHSSLPRQGEQQFERLSDRRFRRMVDYLHASLGEEVSLADLAELVGLSPSYFLISFRKATGKTPHRYLTELRITKACEMLRNPRLPSPPSRLRSASRPRAISRRYWPLHEDHAGGVPPIPSCTPDSR